MSAKKIVIQQKLDRSDEYQELWPKTDCYTKTETDSMIQPLQNAVWQIGDVRGTVKNDLSDDWILCDGRYANLNTFPKLGSYLETQENIISTETAFSYSLPNGFSPSSGTFAKCNGWYIWSGTILESGKYYMAVAYTLDLETWNVSKLSTSAYSSLPQVPRVQYVNGYYYICQGVNYSTDTIFYRFYYASSLDSWHSADFSGESVSIIQLAYGDGKWVLTTKSYSGSYYVCTTEEPSSFSRQSTVSSLSWVGIVWDQQKWFLLNASTTPVLLVFNDILDPTQYTQYTYTRTDYTSFCYLFNGSNYFFILEYDYNNKQYFTNLRRIKKEDMSEEGSSYLVSVKYGNETGFRVIGNIGESVFVYYIGQIIHRDISTGSKSIDAIGLALEDNEGAVCFTSSSAAFCQFIKDGVAIPTIASVDNVKYYIKGKESN